MKNIYLTRYKKRALLLSAALFTAVLLVVFCLAFGVSASATIASAYTIGSESPFNTGASLDFSVDTTTYAKVYNIPLSFGEQGTTPDGDGIYRSGNFYSSNPIYLSTYNGDVRITDTSMKNTTLYADMAIPEGDLSAAIKDRLVSVKASLYIKWGTHAEEDGSQETALGYFYYYSGKTVELKDEYDNVVGTQKESESKQFGITFSCDNGQANNTSTFLAGGFELPSSYLLSGSPFFRLKISNFNDAKSFSLSIREIGVRLTIGRTVGLSLRTVETEIIDPTGLRNAAAGENEVKAGDIILLTNELVISADSLEIDRATSYDSATSDDGRFYRKLFLQQRTDDFLSYIYLSNELTKVTSYEDAGGNEVKLSYQSGNETVYLEDDHSGLHVAFMVESSTTAKINLTLKTWVATGEETNVKWDNAYYLDTEAANQPFLTDNVFSGKYIGRSGKSFFTDSASYIEGTDENNVTVIAQINLGAKGLSANPRFTDNSLTVRTGEVLDTLTEKYYGSRQAIYYKATAWTGVNKPSSSDEMSEGFDLSEATGIYCTVVPTGQDTSNVVYEQLLLTMPTEMDGSLTVYKKQAIFSIEFITVDYVGNYSYCPTKYYISVDVTDYAFVYYKKLAIDSDDNDISNSECTVSFTTLDEYGQPKAKTTTTPTFKRGDKVVAYVKLTNSAQNKYILTSFTTGTGVYINTEKYKADSTGSLTVNQGSEILYAFIVDTKFVDNPEKRVLNFSFKFRATLSITGNSQSYTGYGIKVNVSALYNGNKIPGNARITTTYSETEDGEYVTAGPVDVGTYFVRCELKNNDSYYAYETTTLTITPATPRVTKVVVDPIDYGQSLSVIDFDEYSVPSEFNTAIHCLNTDKNYYFDRSYDGVYGYFKINTARLSVNSNSYVKPNAGYLTVPLVFVPIKTETDGSGRVTYLRDVDGKFVEDANYSRLDTISVEVAINYSTAVSVTVTDVGYNNTVTYEYDGAQKAIEYTIVSTLENGQNLIGYSEVSYATAPEDGSSPIVLESAPVNAGTYTATIKLLEGAGCNYTGSFNYTLVIEKRSLNIEGYTAVTNFRFQQESPFALTAYYGRGSTRVDYPGLNYRFTYYFYNGVDAETSAVDENLVPESEFFAGTGMPQYAGQYVAKAEIDENNFENAAEKYIRFNIRQADGSYESMVMTVPTVAFNSAARVAHVNYLQQLCAILLTGNQNTGVKFEYHVYQRNVISYEARKLTGRFIVTNREFRAAGSAEETAEQFVESTQSYNGYDVGRQTAYLYFIPDDSRNFLPVGRLTEIVVGKADFDLQEVTITPITYGQSVATIADLTVTENVRVSLGGGDYKTLDKTSETEGYSYELVGVDATKLYPAGDNYVVVKVTPRDTERFNVLNETLVLHVNKQLIAVDYAVSGGTGYVVEDDLRVYTYAYGTAVRPTFLYTARLRGASKIYTDGEIAGSVAFCLNDGGTQGDPVQATAATLPVGSYFVTFTVNDSNYIGSIVYRYEIEKDDLVLETLPSIIDAENRVVYNELLSDVTFYAGTMTASSTGVRVAGTFSFRAEPGARFTDTGVRRDYYLTFTPNDLDTYNVCASDGLKLALTVGKADVGAGLNVTVDNPEGGFMYGDLSVDTDLIALVHSSTSTAVETVISVDGLPGSGYLPVGNYPVTVTVDDQNYRGSFTDPVGIVVKKRPAKIVLYADQYGETNEKIFRNRNQSVGCALFAIDEYEEYTQRVTSENISQTFTLNGLSRHSAPAEIGRYDVVLSLQSSNYEASDLVTTLTIKVDPAQIRVTNLDQTYNVPRSVIVSLGLNDAMYTVSYEGRTDGVIYTAMPTEAGQYLVRLTFAAESNNGYAEEIVYSENGETKYLTIGQYRADIVVNKLVTVNYTGTSYDLHPTTEPYGLNYITEYLAEGSDEWTTEEVLSANSSATAHHRVRFTISEKNYYGTTEIEYHVNKAPLTVVSAPTFGTFVYNTDLMPELLAAGRVDFADRADLDGEYTLDLSAVSLLAVGKHRVTFTFIAHNGLDLDGNFLPATGQCDLTVVKKTLSDEDFVLGQNVGNVVEYNGSSFSLDADVVDGSVYDRNGANADFRLLVYYNNNVNPPTAPGTYEVRVTVSSRNYQGTYHWDKDFIINKGKPVVAVKPSIVSTNYLKGDEVTTSDIEPGTGRAVIAGKDVNVSGDFTVVTTILSKANYNDVEVIFTPYETDRFESINFYLTFFAQGENPLPGVTEGESWDGRDITVLGLGTAQVEVVSSSAVSYGEKLRAFTLRFTGEEEAVRYLNDFGLLSFVYPDSIPDAGNTAVEVRYTPYGENADVYTIMNGTVTVTVDKAVLDAEVEVKSFMGLTRSQSEFLLYVNGEIVKPAGGSVRYYTDDTLAECIDDEIVSADGVGYYVFSSDNYVDLTGYVDMTAVGKLAEENIEVVHTEKNYDGRIISYEDLYIRILNTTVAVDEEDVRIAVYKDGVRTDGIDVGTYTVVIYVENELVYGTKEVLFTVNKRDVSEDLALDRYASVYGSVVAPKATLDGEYVDTSVYAVTIKYKSVNAGVASYNGNLPVRAGQYDVKVTVAGENYAGEKVFTYTVQKLPVRLVADSTYSYNYGSAQSLSVSFRSTDGYDGIDLEYSVYYYSSTYSMSKTVPTGAGEYIARIVMEESDYSINGASYAEVNYVINRLPTTITTAPTALNAGEGYHLLYGQALGELSITGGRATRNDVTVSGVFVVVDNGEKPDAGSYFVTVRFLPTDKNYAESTTEIPIVIGKGAATVTFEKLQASYTGASRRSALRYVVEPAGIAVNVVFINAAGERLTNPVAAGTYNVEVTSNDKNYKVVSTLDRFGNAAVFTIAKAAVREIVEPRTNPLSVGESVEKSSVISGSDYGLVYYEGFANPVPGAFSFVESSLVFTAAGTYAVDYVFIPTDKNNYAEGRGTTSITIKKAVATIIVSDNVFTYAGGFTYPTFTTYPAGLTVKHDITMREYDPTLPSYVYDERDYADVGTYDFHAWVEDVNYESEVTEFRIIINKKQIDIDFINESGATVQQYSTTYGVTPEVGFTLYPVGTAGKVGYLLKDETRNGVHITDTYDIRYQANDKNLRYDDHRAPVEIGTYSLTVTLVNNNYTAEKTVLYKITKGKIRSVSFDTDSIENQVYGAVTAPIVLTEPTGVQYKIIYHGTNGGLMPTDAGSYNITVQFNDDNYESMQVAAKFKISKKKLTVTGLTVSDKTYDGTPTLAITGTLYGVLPGDEIEVALTAETADGSYSVGSHYVKITSCKLSGLQAANYDLVYPTYGLPVTIYGNKVTAKDSSSFITATGGFEEGTTVEFSVVNSSTIASTFFENLTGRSTKVIGYTVKENGADALVSDVFKVYIEIPDEFVDADFEVKGVGALSGKNVVFSREGNYITFYASSSGQVQFKKTEFKYTGIVILVSIGIVFVALVSLLVITPIVRGRKLRDDSMEKAYAKRTRRGY